MAAFPIVDCHQHFWDLGRNYHPWLCDEPLIPFRYGDYSAIRRDYLPPHYRADAGSQPVVQTVYVETEWDPADPLGEVAFAAELAHRFGLPNAVVAQAWLDAVDVEAVLDAHARHPLVRGVRHKPRTTPAQVKPTPRTPGAMDDPRWRAGFALLAPRNLSFDLQVPAWHLAQAAELAADFGDTTIVLNHTGLPADRSPTGLGRWRRGMALLAQCPNVAVKISGLGLPGRPWRVDDQRPVVEATLELFGVERCMFASNFPVDRLVADFDTIFSGFKTLVADLDPAAQRRLFHDNAVATYRLDPAPTGDPGSMPRPPAA
ncbi:MAG: amidohydrolase family protein [Candidatus Competibacterales bacterium]